MEFPSKVAWLALAMAMAAALVVMPCAAQNSAQDYLTPHNAARQAIGVEALSWDTTLESYARTYAAQRQADCRLEHSNGPYGENLYWGPAGYPWTAAHAVDLWVKEKQYYDHGSNTCSAPPQESCGHYTQVVWRNTTAVGCARVVCDNNRGIFIVCSYSPRGNYPGQSPY